MSYAYLNIFQNSGVEGVRTMIGANTSQIQFFGQTKDQTTTTTLLNLNYGNTGYVQGMILYQTDA